MSSFYLRYRLHLREQELTFLGMITTFSQCITLDCIQQKFRTHFNKSIKRKTIIDYFNYVKVRVTVDYDLCFSYDHEPPKLKYCYFPRDALKDRKFCRKNSIIIDTLQMTVLRFDTDIPQSDYDYDSESDTPDYFLQFNKQKVYMLVANCGGKILFCKTYINYDDIYLDVDRMFTKLCDDLSKNCATTNKCIFILGPSLPLSSSMNNTNNIPHPMETLTSESITSDGIDVVASKYESTRVENCDTRLQESFSHIGTTYLLARGHSVIIGKFNTSPYLIPLLEIASYWKNNLESRLKHCRHMSKALRESENYIRKLNIKKHFKNFPAIS